MKRRGTSGGGRRRSQTGGSRSLFWSRLLEATGRKNLTKKQVVRTWQASQRGGRGMGWRVGLVCR